ncbi:ferredoxin [Mycolicibacterium psychrotolerans]|uniref:Ferredoxin n=1 Tax=Mycolicibacterium psychrotolerans TaxID=216929 RepID=A0A7I7M7W2_9MYCO|nr:ferredoxin [Mycolicibacterium psychrotolerans]BBX67459.1 ferredoxin [Mycolicibacterium psychrotolerans]
MKVLVDGSMCVGHGLCEAAVPEVFEVTDEGFATVRQGEVANTDPDRIRSAVNSCPACALTMEE